MPDKKKSFKEGGPGSKIGNFLRSIEMEDVMNVASVATSFATGNVAGGINAIKNIIDNDENIKAEDKAIVNSIIALEYADLANARQTQVAIATSENSTTLAKNFIYYLAMGTFVFAVTVVIMLFLIEIPESNKDVVNFILGIIIGTGLVGIYQFFFGSSQGSKDAGEKLRNLLKK